MNKLCGLVIVATTVLVLMTGVEASESDTMTATEFVALAERASRAMFPPLTAEAQAIGAAVKAAQVRLKQELDVQRQRGEPPAFCPPDGGRWLAPMEILDAARAAGPADPRSLKDLIGGLMARKYPCAPRPAPL